MRALQLIDHTKDRYYSLSLSSVWDLATLRAARALIDLSQVEFIGSGGIRMFITIARALGRKGGKLVLYGAQPPVAQVFATTSLNDIVPVRADAAAAAAAVRA